MYWRHVASSIRIIKWPSSAGAWERRKSIGSGLRTTDYGFSFDVFMGSFIVRATLKDKAAQALT